MRRRSVVAKVAVLTGVVSMSVLGTGVAMATPPSGVVQFTSDTLHFVGQHGQGSFSIACRAAQNAGPDAVDQSAQFTRPPLIAQVGMASEPACDRARDLPATHGTSGEHGMAPRVGSFQHAGQCSSS